MYNQKKAEARRKEIVRMVEHGKSFREIGETFHISRGRASQLYEREMEVSGRNCLGMDVMLYNVVKRSIGADPLTLAGITKFVQQPDWKGQLASSYGIGPKRLKDFEAFCREKGILKG